MWRYSQNLQSLYEIPAANRSLMEKEEKNLLAGKPDDAKQILQLVLKEGRTILNEFESKQIYCRIIGIPVVKTVVADTAEEAVVLAKKLGFPCVLKLSSQTITHKTDVGGVKLNLKTPEDVLQAFLEIRTAVAEKAGKEHFAGVTIQPMITHPVMNSF